MPDESASVPPDDREGSKPTTPRTPASSTPPRSSRPPSTQQATPSAPGEGSASDSSGFRTLVTWIVIAILLIALAAFLIYIIVGCSRISVMVVAPNPPATGAAAAVQVSPTPTITNTRQATAAASLTPTGTLTATAISTHTATATATASATATAGATLTATASPSMAATRILTATRTRTRIPIPVARTPTPVPAPVSFDSIYLHVSPVEEPGLNDYEVQMSDPNMERRRGEFSFTWALKALDDCNPETGRSIWQPGNPTKWQARWVHPDCTHTAAEELTVIVRFGNLSADLRPSRPPIQEGNFGPGAP
jgi:hypothetical protein